MIIEILKQIAKEKKCSMSELYSSMFSALDFLEENKFIKVERSKIDNKRVSFEIMESGKEFLKIF